MAMSSTLVAFIASRMEPLVLLYYTRAGVWDWEGVTENSGSVSKEVLAEVPKGLGIGRLAYYLIVTFGNGVARTYSFVQYFTQ